MEKDVEILIQLIIDDFSVQLKNKPDSSKIIVRCCDEFFNHIDYKTDMFVKKLENTLKDCSDVEIDDVVYRFDTEAYSEVCHKSLGHVFEINIKVE
jgi:hypothetical protein